LSYFDNIVVADANDSNAALYAEDRAFAAQWLCAAGSPVQGGGAAPRGGQMTAAMLHAVVSKPSVCVEPVAVCLLSREGPFARDPIALGNDAQDDHDDDDHDDHDDDVLGAARPGLTAVHSRRCADCKACFRLSCLTARRAFDYPV